MIEKLLLNFIENNANSQEKEKVISWIEESHENQKKFNELKAKHVASTLKNVKKNQPQNIHLLRRPYKRKALGYMSIAASVLIVLGILWSYLAPVEKREVSNEVVETNSPEFIEVITKNNSQKEIKLPDGSIVSLNANSKLTYPKVFHDHVREISLKGEAFFDITHNKDKPFIVKTEDFNIKVLGTTFNVKSFPDDKQTETTLLSGKVELSLEKETPIVLAPSQKAIFHKKAKKIEIEKVNIENTLAWQSGKLVFNNTSLEQVVIDLERKYNTIIEIASPELLNYKYTGTFDNLTIDEALQLLMISSPIQYEIKTKKIIMSMK